MTNWGLAGGQRLGWGVIDDGWRKGPWTAEEDRLLIDYVKLHGDGRWSSVASVAGLRRNGKSCRLRWVNYLRPDLKRGQITPHEESIILEQHAKWGNRWSTIARSLPGRTDNEIKNYWRTHFKRQTKGTANNNSEKKRTRLLKKKNFQKQQLQQQQWKQKQQEHELQEKEQYCDQLDVEILSLPDQSDNKVLTVPQLRQEISNTMYPNPHPIEEQGISYPTFDNELLLPEDMNEDGVPWDGLWSLEDTHATFMQPVQQTN